MYCRSQGQVSLCSKPRSETGAISARNVRRLSTARIETRSFANPTTIRPANTSIRNTRGSQRYQSARTTAHALSCAAQLPIIFIAVCRPLLCRCAGEPPQRHFFLTSYHFFSYFFKKKLSISFLQRSSCGFSVASSFRPCATGRLSLGSTVTNVV